MIGVGGSVKSKKLKVISLLQINNQKAWHYLTSVVSDGWLAKYCILPKGLEAAYKRTFDAIDMEGRGWLSPVDTMVALRASNTLLTDTQEEYIYRVGMPLIFGLFFLQSYNADTDDVVNHFSLQDHIFFVHLNRLFFAIL